MLDPVGNSSRSNGRLKGARGAASVQLLVILVPVLFGMMGFALDLGQLYLVRGELQTAANSMATAAASQLIGTDLSLDNANTFARLTLDNTTGSANKYFFGGLLIGQTNGNLVSEAPDPSFYATAADAIGAGTGSAVGGAQARHAGVTITADVQLTFWSFLSLATERKVSVAAKAAAGISAPLCTACNIEPIAVAAVDASDTTNFGFVQGAEYTFGYVCTGTPTPQVLPNTSARIPYLLLNRLNTTATVFADEQSQLYRVGAGGLPGSTSTAQSCFTINNPEQIWATAIPPTCSAANPGQSVASMLCGITSRFEPTFPGTCASITDIDTMSSIYPQDVDFTEITDYTQYVGNGRRVITIPIVDVLNATGAMTVLGFRQFVIEPSAGGVDINVGDANGRFPVLYIGSPVPVKQGSFSGCQQSSGPGKVVMHQ